MSGHVVLSVTAGASALIAPFGPDLRWIWAVEAVTSDGQQYEIVYLDYFTGAIAGSQGGTVDTIGPNR